jgi:hypothetical protein
MYYRDKYFGMPTEELLRRKQLAAQDTKKQWMKQMQQRAAPGRAPPSNSPSQLLPAYCSCWLPTPSGLLGPNPLLAQWHCQGFDALGIPLLEQEERKKKRQHFAYVHYDSPPVVRAYIESDVDILVGAFSLLWEDGLKNELEV